MHYNIIPPPNELKDIVSYFWVCTLDLSKQANQTYWVVANSLTEITFAFQDNKKHSELLFTAVQGQTNEPNHFSVKGYYHLFGVSLNSFALPLLFNLPASELNKEFISLNTLLGKEGDMLTEKIALASNTRERINILSNYFIKLLKNKRNDDKIITEAIKLIKKCGGNKKINELSSQFCLSEKQFKRRFKEFSGFTPKLYNRIVRFESVIKSNTNWSTLTEAAHLNGYFDQAHLNHDFKTFTGFSPKDFYKLSEQF
ncbi:AraC family transcriptional regulator [Gaetbulibacter jejuensis]|uniref:HTH araC/xylS-type domain-containing protein n=1 Tax=Gaetbulibacter jejuensis TaxID=584607 RepID=A0ABP3V8J0_9FLAO